MTIPAIPTEELNGPLEAGLRIPARRPNSWASTFPSEVVRCEIAGRADWVSKDHVLRRSDRMYKTEKNMGLL